MGGKTKKLLISLTLIPVLLLGIFSVSTPAIGATPAGWKSVNLEIKVDKNVKDNKAAVPSQAELYRPCSKDAVVAADGTKCPNLNSHGDPDIGEVRYTYPLTAPTGGAQFYTYKGAQNNTHGWYGDNWYIELNPASAGGTVSFATSPITLVEASSPVLTITQGTGGYTLTQTGTGSPGTVAPGGALPYAQIYFFCVDPNTGAEKPWDQGWFSGKSITVKKITGTAAADVPINSYGDIFNESEAGTYITGKLEAGTYMISVNESQMAQKLKDALSWISPGLVATYDFLSNPLGTLTGGVKYKWIGTGSFVVTGSETVPTLVRVEVAPQEVSALAETMSKSLVYLADWVQGALNTSVGYINELLSNTKVWVLGGNMDSAWMEMRNIGIGLLTLGLIIIAFANVVQIDIQKYGLNRMIPRIILAIIMSYFSWLIVVFFFDFTEAIQRQALAMINAHGAGLQTLAQIRIANLSADELMASVGMFLVAISILVIILISTIILLFSLLLRVVYLSFLLVVAPIAFILMIMPFSESLYKKWWTEFWKWMFMGPMAVVIIAIGATIAGSGAPTVIEPNGVSSTNNLIKLLILAGAVYFAGTLPKQWGGSVMASFQGAGKKMWGATGGALGKWAYDRTAGRYVVGRTKSFLALRKQKRDDADRLAVSGAMSKIAGPNEKGRLANFVAGNRIFDKDIQKAQRQADYLKHQADINKTYMVDQLNEQEVKGRRDDILRRKGALGEHETLEDLKSDPARLDKAVNALLSEPEGIAYFKHIAAKGWTDNSVGSFDQRTFHALNAMDRNIAELVRQGNRGFMMNTGDPVMVKTAMDDASKRSPGDYSHQEMERYVALAREGAKRSWTDKEREDRYKELGGKVGRGEKLSSEEFKEFSEAGALSLTKALTDAGLTEMAKKSPQAYSEATKAAAATPAIFSEGAQQHFTAPATPAATPPAGPTPGAGPNDSSML